MTTDNDMLTLAGAGKAIDVTWDELRHVDPAGKSDIENDADDLDELAEDADHRAAADTDDDENALDRDVMDDAVDGTMTDSDNPFSRSEKQPIGHVFRSGRDNL